MKFIRFMFLKIIIIFIFASIIHAHPHVRLLADLEFEYDDKICSGFWIEWRFDDYFSASVIHEFDRNKDGFFDEKEIKEIYDNAFINLKNYGYFVFIRKGKTRIHPQRVEKFTAWQKSSLVFYKFFVPLTKRDYGDDFYVAIFDRTYYCSIEYQGQPVMISQSDGEKPVYEIVSNKDYPIYYDPIGAVDDNKIYKKWKPGLQTAYPEEIHVFFRK